MKNIAFFQTLIFFALSLFNHVAFSQAPQAIPYQAVARNNQGATLTNQSISLRFSLRNMSATGAIVYQETQNISTHILHIDGQGRSTSAFWATTSDQRVKRNVKSLSNTSLQKIMQLRPVTYQWTENYYKAFKGLKQNNTGFISQEFEQVFPEMIEKVEEKFGDETISDFRLLNLSDMPIHLVKAMQEQQAQIETQKQQLEKLQNEIIELKKFIMK